jgi:hypothetical protein
VVVVVVLDVVVVLVVAVWVVVLVVAVWVLLHLKEFHTKDKFWRYWVKYG